MGQKFPREVSRRQGWGGFCLHRNGSEVVTFDGEFSVDILSHHRGSHPLQRPRASGPLRGLQLYRQQAGQLQKEGKASSVKDGKWPISLAKAQMLWMSPRARDWSSSTDRRPGRAHRQGWWWATGGRRRGMKGNGAGGGWPTLLVAWYSQLPSEAGRATRHGQCHRCVAAAGHLLAGRHHHTLLRPCLDPKTFWIWTL